MSLLGDLWDNVTSDPLGTLGFGLFSGGGMADGLFGSLSPDAPQQAAFRPTPVMGPYGSAVMDESGQYVLSLSPEMQMAQRQIRDQLGLGINGQQTQAMRQYAARAGQAGGFLQHTGQQLADLSGGLGGIGNQYAALGGQLAGLDPYLAGTQGLFGGAGASALGMGMGDLAQAGSIDPMAVAQRQYGLMQDVMAPGREQQRLAQEGRLLRQGLLGGTAGRNAIRGQSEAFAQADRTAAANALAQGQAARGTALNQAFGQIGAGQGLLGAGAGLAGQRAGLLGQRANLTTAQANLVPMQANLLKSSAGLFGQGAGMFQVPVSMEQQGRSNYANLLSQFQGLGQGLFQTAGLGMGGGAQQAAINANNAAMQQQAANQRADMFGGLLMGGLGALVGGPAGAAVGMNLAGAMGGGGGAMPQPQLFMQNPYQNMNVGLGGGYY